MRNAQHQTGRKPHPALPTEFLQGITEHAEIDCKHFSPTRPQKKSNFLIWETVYSLGKKTFPSHDNFFNLN